MKLTNKQAHRDYMILEHLEAGIALTGPEVKAIRTNHASLDGAHVRIMNGEAYLINAKIYPYKFAHDHSGTYNETRRRKLLLHRKELTALKSRLDSGGGGLALVPLAIYTKNKRFKVEIALAKGKKQYEKKQDIKARDLDRLAEEELKKWR